MPFPRPNARFALASITIAPLVAVALVYGCTSSDNVAPGGADAATSACGTLEVCFDATVDDVFVPQGDDSSPATDTGTDAGGPAEDAPSTLDASDAGDSSDAAVAVDADQNCVDYTTPAVGNPTAIRVMNHRDSGIYLGTPAYRCDGLNFGVTDTATNAVLDVAQHNAEYTCSQLQVACPPVHTCDSPVVVEVMPGGYWELPWTGTYFAPEPMPAHCYIDGGAACDQPTCIQEFGLTTATVSALVYPQALCGDASTPVACTQTCSPDTNGACYVPNGAVTAGTPVTISNIWDAGEKIVPLIVP